MEENADQPGHVEGGGELPSSKPTCSPAGMFTPMLLSEDAHQAATTISTDSPNSPPPSCDIFLATLKAETPQEEEEELSAFEQERLRIMATNRAFLQALDLSSTTIGLQPISTRSHPRRRPAKPVTPSEAETPPPKRPCTQRRAAVRARALISGQPEPPALESESVPSADPEESNRDDAVAASPTNEEFAESSVHLYACDGERGALWDWCPSTSMQNVDALMGFKRGTTYATEVSRIYSLDLPPAESSAPALLLVAGHQGKVSIVGLARDPAEQDPAEALLSFQAHSKWIGNALWLRDLCFLTAGADDAVRVWDASQTGLRQGKPVLRTEVRDLNDGSPLFCADVQHGLSDPCTVATGARDGSIALSQITAGGIRGSECLAVHEGPVKCLKFRLGSGLTLSTGNDATLQISDIRCGSSGGVLKIINVHNGGANSCCWQGTADIVMSSGCDHTIKLWDIRGGAQHEPLHVLKGHAGTTQRAKVIIHPIFYGNGKFVVTPGERSTQLSLYRVSDGKCVSRGDIGQQATTLTTSGPSVFLNTGAHVTQFRAICSRTEAFAESAGDQPCATP